MIFQNDLLELLRAFDLKSASDFERLPPERKHYFVSRLYKCFERGLSVLSTDLGSLGGLKLGYEKDLGVDVNVNDVYLKKVALYSSCFVVTCPVEEVHHDARPSKSKRIEHRERYDSATLAKLRADGQYVFGDVKAHQRSHGGEIHIEGRAYILDKRVLHALITSVVELREALAAGVALLLPALPGQEKKLRSELRKADVASGNFKRTSLLKQFTEDGLSSRLVDAGLTTFYLPHLTTVPLSDVLEVRERHRVAFEQFQAALTAFLFSDGKVFSEGKLEDYLRTVDQALREIRARLEELRRRHSWQNREALIRYIALGIVAFTPHEIRNSLLAFLGTITAGDFLHSTTDYYQSRQEITSGTFYVPWLLAKKARGG